ncbi:MAG: transporter [Acidiphilium sp.]
MGKIACAGCWGLKVGISGVLGALAAVVPALASQPLPYDLPTPPPNISVAMLYNEFSSAGGFYTTKGTRIGDTRIVTDTPILRFVHTFSPVGGLSWGVEVIAAETNFLGQAKLGGNDLTSQNGFGEPRFAPFVWPIDNPAKDEYLVLAYFVSPPLGAYDAGINLNPGTNNWVNNPEAGYGHILAGRPKGRRLDFEIWLDGYFYGTNDRGPAVGLFRSRLHTEPAGQVIVYLPYYFYPKTDAYVGLSFEQTFGGKQYLTVSGPFGLTADTGNRNDVSSIGVNAGSFLAPTVFAEASLTTDVRVRGGPKSTTFIVQVGKVF